MSRTFRKRKETLKEFYGFYCEHNQTKEDALDFTLYYTDSARIKITNQSNSPDRLVTTIEQELEMDLYTQEDYDSDLFDLIDQNLGWYESLV